MTDATITVSDEILIGKNLMIEGPGNDLLTLSGDHAVRIFHLLPDVTLHLRGMTLRDGFGDIRGGALLMEGDIILENIVLKSNFEGSSPRAFTAVPGATTEIGGSVVVEEQVYKPHRPPKPHAI